MRTHIIGRLGQTAILLAVALTGAAGAQAQQTAGAAASTAAGEAVYKQRCAGCHDNSSGGRAPSRAALQQLTAERILRTLDFGLMMSIAYPMKRPEREAVAKFLGTADREPGPPASSLCSADRKPLADAASANANWNGWSSTSSNTRYQDAQQAGMTAAEVPRLKLKWAFAFPGDVTAFSALSVVNGTLFTGSAGGGVYALDARTGCTHWHYQSAGPVRTAPLVVPDGTGTRARHLLIFSDQIGWVYGLDAHTGKEIWKRKVEQHDATRLTGTPVARNGIVFIPAASWEETRSYDEPYECCTFRGSITALRVSDGAQQWKTFMTPEPRQRGHNSVGALRYGPSGAGIWSSPTFDEKRGVMYITTGDNYSHPATKTSDAVIALDLKTGRIVWNTQTFPNDVYASACQNKGPNCPEDAGPDYDYGAAAMLIRTASGKEVIVSGQKSGMVFGLDPDARGKILWETRVGEGGINGGVQWGMSSDGERVYAATNDAIRIAGGLSSSGGVIGLATFDPAKGGGLTALNILTGKKLWRAQPAPCSPPKPGCSPAQSAALTAIPGAVFSGSLDGHLRAFAAADGKLLWDYDTVREYTPVNTAPGIVAKGGSMDGAGPIVWQGMLYVNSGYPRNGGMPGNVLLAFEAEK